MVERGALRPVVLEVKVDRARGERRRVLRVQRGGCAPVRSRPCHQPVEEGQVREHPSGALYLVLAPNAWGWTCGVLVEETLDPDDRAGKVRNLGTWWLERHTAAL